MAVPWSVWGIAGPRANGSPDDSNKAPEGEDPFRLRVIWTLLELSESTVDRRTRAERG